jgi:hypothetical protein
MKILAIDLGKFNSVACLFDTKAHGHEQFGGKQVGFFPRNAAALVRSFIPSLNS